MPNPLQADALPTIPDPHLMGPRETPPPADGSDAHLMSLARQGDRDAFGLLVDRHRDALVNTLTRLCSDRERALDLAQETFIRLYRAAERYQEQGNLQAYLYRIAINLLRSSERKERRWPWTRFEVSRHGGQNHTTPQDSAMQDEMARKVGQAIARLPSRFRVPLVLHTIEGWPITQIAETLGCREGTVKSRISRARQGLRSALADYLPGGAR